MFWHNDPCVLQFVTESSVCQWLAGEGWERAI